MMTAKKINGVKYIALLHNNEVWIRRGPPISSRNGENLFLSLGRDVYMAFV